MNSLTVCVFVFIALISAIGAESRFDPEVDIHFHLFTRRNPTVSQPLLRGDADILASSNYDPRLRTVISIHGWNGHVVDDYNLVTIPAFLTSDDVNLIVIDWHSGSLLLSSAIVESGRTIARFIDWIRLLSGRPAEDFHIVGFSLGSHLAGVTARNVDGGIGYVTILDPSGTSSDETRFRPDDGLYTEAIYTNAGIAGFFGNLASVNFYPNGGVNMPGCGGDNACNHFRAYFYFGESIVSGGFTGTECARFEFALAGDCDLPGRLDMGARLPSYGVTGTYHLLTNAGPPFSID
ncbi:pancreatic lipase-related protein 2-like [Plodia interpunctella]|uniref:pancreatic lipase-related protein 2-like n=1 Tax=Plodia interpunctella TaxID=58824 RepID=UPI002368BDF3|nr:pancreatic lipase-related protein 2-like [Plodia interpunctella]